MPVPSGFRGRRVYGWLLILGLTVLVALPPSGGSTATLAAPPSGASSEPMTSGHPFPTSSTSAADPSAPPAVTADAYQTSLSSSHPVEPTSGPHLGGIANRARAPADAAPSASSTTPSYVWSSAFILYGPPPPPDDLLLGEGAGLVTDNALNETVMFGGLASGGLSNVTWIYAYYFNASDPANATEYGGFTSSPTSPSARTNASFAVYQSGGVALLFGGLTDLGRQTTANDTWLYYFGNDTWVNITRPGGPPPREQSALAIDQKDGIALLFGGIAPEYTNGGSTGAVIWQDTWEFRFSTDTWTQLSPSTSPADRFGASMVWDSVDDRFLLAAGCSLSCSMNVWAFDPGNASDPWSELTQTGTVPPGREGASFAWDPNGHRAVLYGGLSFGSDGSLVAYSDSYELLPSGQWIKFLLGAPGPAPVYQPGPIYDASTTWSDFPGCDAMWVMGGDPSLSAIPEFVYVIQPSNSSPPWQCWTAFSEPQKPPGPPPPCSRQSLLVVNVTDRATLDPIPNAIVEISGQCLPATGRTGADGSIEFVTNTPDNISINVSADGFHGAQMWYNYTYTNTTANTSKELIRYVNMSLVPYPSLHVRVLGNTGGVLLVPVPYASVVLNNFSVFAITNAAGWGNDSAVPEFNQSVIVSATAHGFSTAWTSVHMPYTGPANATLVILIDGNLTVSVVNARSGQGIPGASGEVTHLDPGLPAPFHYTTDGNGRFTAQLPMGNYSAGASAPGFLANLTGGRALVPWVYGATITIRLQPRLGTNESVRLLDAYSGAPISGGTVTFGDYPPLVTGAQGWANGTNLLPPGRILVLGQASGYFPNSTTIVLAYNTVLPPISMRLAPNCFGGCPNGTTGTGVGGSPFLPVGGTGLLFLLSAPAALVVAGAFFAVALSVRRGNRGRPISPPSGASPR